MPKRLLALSLAGLLAAGCSFDKWPSSQKNPDPQDRSAERTQPDKSDTTVDPVETSAQRPPDVALAHIQEMTRRANLQPARSIPLEVPPMPATTGAKPAPVAEPVTPAAAVITPAQTTPELKWLDNRNVELTLGPKQDSTPPAPAPAEASATAPVTVSPAVAVRPGDSLETKIAQQARDFPRDLSAQLDFQFLQMLKGQQTPQMDSISALPRDDREMLAATMDAMTNLRANLKNDPNLSAGQKARPLVELADRLRSGADLRISTLAICSRVDGFGVYQPLQVDRVPAGREFPAVLYCEVANFLSRQSDGGQWETNLSQEITLYNDRGQRVWSEKPKAVKDLCRNRRHDFFLGQRITLPSSLNPGSYSLRVTIVDQNANRVAEGTAAVKVVGER